MRCHKCGAASRVIETREEDAKTVLRRRRLCDNGHRFNTYEVGERIMNAVTAERRERALGTVLSSIETYVRDLRVWKACQLEGLKQIAVAMQENLGESTVWRINRMFPRLNPEHVQRLEAEHGRKAACSDASRQGGSDRRGDRR